MRVALSSEFRPTPMTCRYVPPIFENCLVSLYISLSFFVFSPPLFPFCFFSSLLHFFPLLASFVCLCSLYCLCPFSFSIFVCPSCLSFFSLFFDFCVSLLPLSVFSCFSLLSVPSLSSFCSFLSFLCLLLLSLFCSSCSYALSPLSLPLSSSSLFSCPLSFLCSLSVLSSSSPFFSPSIIDFCGKGQFAVHLVWVRHRPQRAIASWSPLEPG